MIRSFIFYFLFLNKFIVECFVHLLLFGLFLLLFELDFLFLFGLFFIFLGIEDYVLGTKITFISNARDTTFLN